MRSDCARDPVLHGLVADRLIGIERVGDRALGC
jgi:hypothetical protein